MKRLLIVLLLAAVPLKGAAQWDTASHIMPTVAGGCLLAGGSMFTFVPQMKDVAVNLRDAVQADGHRKLHFDDYVQYLPAIATPALKLCGLESRHSWDRLVLLEGGSYLLGFVVVEGAKHIFDVERPDGSAYNSFPSGHTFTAFCGAEVLRREYGEEYPWLAVAGYTVAVVIGAMRIYNNRHWLGDVLAGAGIGVLSTTAVYWINEKLEIRN